VSLDRRFVEAEVKIATARQAEAAARRIVAAGRRTGRIALVIPAPGSI